LFGRARAGNARGGWWLSTATVVVVLSALVGLAGASGAAAKKHVTKTTVVSRPTGHALTLRYFADTVTSRLMSPKGKDLGPKAKPVKGDRLEVVEHDFAGTKAKHARRYAAVDHLSCLYQSPTTATCDDVFSVGGSEIQAEHQRVLFAGPITSFAITGGTGKYRGARGLITVTELSSKTSTVSIVVLAGRS
jgi:hypothetical protein